MKLVSLLTVCIVFVGMLACSSEPPSKLVGRWERSQLQGAVTFVQRWEFFADGRFELSKKALADFSVLSSGSYKMAGADKVEVNFGTETETVDIVSLTDTQLQLRAADGRHLAYARPVNVWRTGREPIRVSPSAVPAAPAT